jgi:hypothetical protein
VLDQILATLGAYAAAFMTLLLLASAAHKAIEPGRLAVATQALTGLPPQAAWPLLVLAGLVEAGAGLSLLAPAARAWAGAAASVVWAAYLGAILLAMSRGSMAMDCGCNFGAGRKRLSLAHVQRNLILVVVALCTAAFSTLKTAPPPPFDLSHLLAAAAFFALYVAADEIAAIRPGNQRPWAT